MDVVIEKTYFLIAFPAASQTGALRRRRQTKWETPTPETSERAEELGQKVSLSMK